MALRKSHLGIFLFILITTLFFVLVLVAFSACGEDKETATTQAGEAQTSEAAPTETDQVIDQAAVAAMDVDEFRAVMTTAADRLAVHLGSEDAAFLAVLFAVDRGYDAYQLLTGSWSDQVGADGRIAAANGSTVSPARTTTRIFSLPDDTADASDRPVLLASLAGGLFVADSTAYGGAEMDLGVGGVFPINDALGVIKAGFDASRAKVEEEADAESQLRELQEEHAKIALILAARGYDAQQITEAAILGQIRIFLDPVEGEFPDVCWYIEHTSGTVLRPVNPPLDIFAEMSCPAPDKEAPTTYDRETVRVLLDSLGLGENAPAGGGSGSAGGASPSGATPGAPGGQTPPSAEESGPPDIDLNGQWKGTTTPKRAAIGGQEITADSFEGCDVSTVYRTPVPLIAELELRPDGTGTLEWTGDSVGLETGHVETLGSASGSLTWEWKDEAYEFVFEAEGQEGGIDVGTLIIRGSPRVLENGTMAFEGTWSVETEDDLFDTGEVFPVEAEGVVYVEKQLK